MSRNIIGEFSSEQFGDVKKKVYTEQSTLCNEHCSNFELH